MSGDLILAALPRLEAGQASMAGRLEQLAKIPVTITSRGLSVIEMIAASGILGRAKSTAHIRRHESPMKLPR